MLKRPTALILVLGFFVCVAEAQAPASKYPVMDAIAQRVIDKYNNSTCVQLAVAKSEKPTGEKAAMEQRAIAMMKADPQMRAAFIDKIAGPVVNKMFECGMVP
jgi:ABC-type transporter MlaC component